MYIIGRNSIERVILISFLFFANSILLVHIVVPHYYYNEFPTTNITTYYEYNDLYHHDEIQPVQQDKNVHKLVIIESCLLAPVYIWISNSRQVISSLDFDIEVMQTKFGIFIRSPVCAFISISLSTRKQM